MAAESSRPLPDAEARTRATTDFGTSLVVLAGAGTGKTSLLVERALNAIGSGVATIDGIAAITFTEKAAGEMRERLALSLERLRAVARGELEPETKATEADRAWRHLVHTLGLAPATIAERSLAALEALDRGAVVTIHRFCADLLRAHPVESRVDPAFTVDSGGAAEALLDSAWESFLLCELGPEASRSELWRRILDRTSLDTVAQVARGLASFRTPLELLGPLSTAPPHVAEALAEEAGRLAGDIGRLLERQRGLAGRAFGHLTGMQEVLGALASGGLAGFQPALAARPRLVSDIDDDYHVAHNARLEGVSRDELLHLARRVRRFARRVVRIDEELCGWLVEAAAPFVHEWREAYLRGGLVSFDGLLALARALLRDHPEVRRRLKRRLKLLLVDEFQDTDPLQYEIVLFLAEREADAADVPYAARLEPGRLFVVGDAKQSIYRFRGADYAAYRRAVGRIIECGGAQLDLTGNFRSVPEILEPVNRMFEDPASSWRASRHQPDYVPLTAVRSPAGSARVELWSVGAPADAHGVEEMREAEGRTIAETVERWVAEGRWAYRQITILFRAFSSISFYLRPLRERGIPFVVDGGREFLERPEVAELLGMLAALSQPADEAALLAFLRSPAGGVSDLELARYAAAGGRFRWAGTDVDGGLFPGVARSFALLRRLREESRHLPADAVVRRVVASAQLLPLGAAAYEGAQRVANLQKLAAAAGELARDGRLSLEEVVEALARGLLEDLKTDRPLADDAAEAVRITSIHRMKGLENDVVLLPDLARERGSRDTVGPAVEVLLSEGRPALALRAGTSLNSARVLYDLEDARHEEAEEIRVLYVALTRAREQIVLVAREPRAGGEKVPWLRALAAWGYDVHRPPADGERLVDGRVLHLRRAAPARCAAEPAEPPEQVVRAVRAYTRAVSALRAAATPPFALPSGLGGEELDEARADLRPAGRLSRDLGKAAGVVLHGLLESWDGGDPEALRRRLAAACAETARQSGVDPKRLERESAAVLESFLGTDLARRLGEVELLGRELPLLLRDETGQLYRGSIDLLYREQDGRLVVADYKTDDEADEAALAARYRDQLDVYARAVEGAWQLAARPRTELWLLRSGRRVVLAG